MDQGTRGFKGIKALATPGAESAPSVPASPSPASLSPPPSSPSAPVQEKGRNEHAPALAAPPRSGISSAALLCFALCVAAALTVLVVRNSDHQDIPAAGPGAATASAISETPSPPPALVFMPEFSVAAVNANLRSAGHVGSKALGLIPRGTSVQRIEELGPFMHVKLADGREGWIVRELLIDLGDAIRLQALNPKTYIASRAEWQALIATRVETYKELANALLTEVIKDSPLINQAMTAMADSVLISIPTDPAAGTWYGLEARSFSDKTQLVAAYDSAQAAAAAEPSNPDRLVSAAFAAMKVKDYPFATSIARDLIVLAPKSTNTWVIVGATAAMVDVELLAQNAFVTALRISRDTKVTQKFLTDLSVNASDPRITSAITSALARWRSAAPEAQR